MTTPVFRSATDIAAEEEAKLARLTDPNHDLTWEELVERQPWLAELERMVLAVDGSDPRFCANEAWFGYGAHRGHGIKPRMERLVGWLADAPDPTLRTSAAYDAAYRALYRLLPDCAGCGCPSVADLLGAAS